MFPIIVLLIVAFVEIGRAVFAYNTIANAARQAARVAAVNQLAGRDRLRRVPPDRGSVRAALVDQGLRHRRRQDAGHLDVERRRRYVAPPGTTLTCEPTLHVGCIAAVTVTYDFGVSTPFVSWSSGRSR